MTLEQSAEVENHQAASTIVLDAKTDNPMDLSEFCGRSYSEEHSITVEHLDTSAAEAEVFGDIALEKEAKTIYENGNALQFMEGCCHRQHFDNDLLIRTLILSFAGTKVLNNSISINVHVSGPAGSGKSDSGRTVLRIIPGGKQLSGRFSDKYLLYVGDTLPAGSVIMMDDQDLRPEQLEILKVQASAANETTRYMTLVKQQPVKIKFPPRCPRWFFRADASGDAQSNDRELHFFTDDSPEHQEAIVRKKCELAESNEKFEDTRQERICLKIWNFIPDTDVIIPYGTRIQMKWAIRLRELELFF